VSPSTPTKTTFLLTRKDLDFPLGLGSAIIDVEMEMEWLVPPAAGAPTKLGEVQEPAVSPLTEDSQVSGDEGLGKSVLVEPVQAVVGGTPEPELVEKLVEGKQGVEG
jgi:phosphatidylinositol-3,4,5-trisphosphate 3-phosphatase/dual-specificity protein phosphatase PTEN